MNYLSSISRIFEQNQIVTIQTDVSIFLAFMKQVLTDIDDAGIFMMRTFRKQVCHSGISFGH